MDCADSVYDSAASVTGAGGLAESDVDYVEFASVG